jgi:hypothetical protein
MIKMREICFVVLAGFIFQLGYTSEARICPPKSDKGVIEGVGNAGGTAGSNVDMNSKTQKPIDKPLSPQQVAEDLARAQQKAEADERAARKTEEKEEARQRAIDDAVAKALSKKKEPEPDAETRADKPEPEEPPAPPEPPEPIEPPDPSEPSEPKVPDPDTSGTRVDKDIGDRFRAREDSRSRTVGDRTQGDIGRDFAGGYKDGRKTPEDRMAKVDADLEKLEKQQREKEKAKTKGHGQTTRTPSSGGEPPTKGESNYYIIKESSKFLERAAECTSTAYNIVGPVTEEQVNQLINDLQKSASKKIGVQAYPFYISITVAKVSKHPTKPTAPKGGKNCKNCPPGQHIGLDPDKRFCHGECPSGYQWDRASGKCVMNVNEEFIKKLEKMRDYGKTFNPY